MTPEHDPAQECLEVKRLIRELEGIQIPIRQTHRRRLAALFRGDEHAADALDGELRRMRAQRDATAQTFREHCAKHGCGVYF